MKNMCSALNVQTENAQRVGASINAPTPEKAAVSKCRLIT